MMDNVIAIFELRLSVQKQKNMYSFIDLSSMVLKLS